MLADAASFSAAYLTLHVDLKSRLHKGEETGTHSYRHIPSEHFAQNALNHYLSGGKCNIFVHNESFILEKCSLVMGIRRLVSVYTSRVHEPVRRLVRLHIADTSACQMGAKAELLVCASAVMAFQPVGIHALPGRMVGRKVQFIERIHLTCDLILFKNLKSHGAERIVQVIAHLRDRMKSPAGRKNPRNRAVKIGGYFRSFQLQLHSLFIDQFLDLVLRLIQQFSHFRTNGYVQRRDIFHQKAECSLLSDIRAFHILKFSLTGRFRNPDFCL